MRNRKRDRRVATQTDQPDQFDLENFKCPVTHQYFFDPVMASPCGHAFESAVKNQLSVLKNCPCCRKEIASWIPCPAPFKTLIASKLSEALLSRKIVHDDIYFDLDNFKQMVADKEGLKKPECLRMLQLLENAPGYLNGTAEGSAIVILAGTLDGRDVLRKKLRITSKKFFFGSAQISPDSLKILVNGKSIREWLCITTAMEILEQKMLASQLATEDALRAVTSQKALLLEASLFVSKRTRILSPDAEEPSEPRSRFDAFNPILLMVVQAKEAETKMALETAKSVPLLLSILLSSAGEVQDYSDRTITGTLLQAAASAGDIAMCQMLKPYFDLIPEGDQEFKTQLSELFPEGFEAHKKQQKKTVFDVVYSTYRQIYGGEDWDVTPALKLRNNGSSLCRTLNIFRCEFGKISQDERVFNPGHLLRAFELYNQLREEYDEVGYSRQNKNHILFWRQIIGFIQRYLPACYAQAFAQGLHCLVNIDPFAPCRSEPCNRSFLFRDNHLPPYFPLSPYWTGLGFDFAVSSQGNPLAIDDPLDPHEAPDAIFRRFCAKMEADFQAFLPQEVRRSPAPVMEEPDIGCIML